MADNIQHKIGRNRPPRVQITYDVEIGDAIQKTELPFVVGIIADLSGLGDNPRPSGIGLKDKSRSFVEIDRDNFSDVMAKIAPSLVVDGALDEDQQPDPNGHLTFRSLDDFSPDVLVNRVQPIWDLQKERSALRDILTKLDSNDKLYDDLMKRIQSKKLADLGKAASDQLAKLEPPAPTS